MYLKAVFEENYSDLYLYQELKMALDCNRMEMQDCKNDTLVLSVPIKVNHIAAQKFLLLLKAFDGKMRSAVVGVDDNVEFRSAPDPIDLPEIIVLNELYSRMSRICSDPFDAEFLDFVNRRYGGRGWASLVEEAREAREMEETYPWGVLNKDEKDFVRRHPICS